MGQAWAQQSLTTQPSLSLWISRAAALALCVAPGYAPSSPPAPWPRPRRRRTPASPPEQSACWSKCPPVRHSPQTRPATRIQSPGTWNSSLDSPRARRTCRLCGCFGEKGWPRSPFSAAVAEFGSAGKSTQTPFSTVCARTKTRRPSGDASGKIQRNVPNERQDESTDVLRAGEGLTLSCTAPEEVDSTRAKCCPVWHASISWRVASRDGSRSHRPCTHNSNSNIQHQVSARRVRMLY